MGRQKSQQTSRKVFRSKADGRHTGTLFIVGTPIGSPDDLTLRARTILAKVSIVAAETPLANATAQARDPQVASTVRMAPVDTDLVGRHGEQDRINQQIYTPGTPPLSGG